MVFLESSRSRCALVIASGLLAAGCTDDPRVETSDPTTFGATTGEDATTGGPVATSDTGSQTSGGSSSTGVGTTGGSVCETSLCGGACCDAGQECAASVCRDACDSGVRCGASLEVCCDAATVCLQLECVPIGDPCLDSFDCAEGEFCEPNVTPDDPLGGCLPQPKNVSCEVLPDFEQVSVELEWSWTQEQVSAIPLVADIDGDDKPEVVFSTIYYDENGDGNAYGNYPDAETEPNGNEGGHTGIIVVLDGENGNEEFRIGNEPQNCFPADNCSSFGSYGRGTPALGDVDGNGLPDIVYSGRPQVVPVIADLELVHAVDGTNTHLWTSHTPAGAQAWILTRNGSPLMVNLDDDEASEVVYGAAVFDNDGTLVWDEGGAGGEVGAPSSYEGALTIAADLTGDGYPELITGRQAWSVDWQVNGIGQPVVTLSELWNAGGVDGYAAVADLDQDGDPEVILVAGGELRVLEGATGELWCGVDPTGVVCAGNDGARTQPIAFPDLGVDEDRGGPPTVADFDGDGRPELATAGASSYMVVDINRDGETLDKVVGFPPAPGELFIRWFAETRDLTSRATGSSVFDFQGDGIAEVLYADECYMRVYNGATGEVIAEVESSSSTIHEYPVIADADGDGNSEILVVSNTEGASSNCEEPGYTARKGVFMYGDPNDQWMRTRRVWPSHTYHVTDSDSSGLTPGTEVNNWTEPGLNNYRQNAQGAGVFNAPDLTADLAVSFENCLDEEFVLVATVRNSGSLGVPAGVEVRFYNGTDNTGTLLDAKETMVSLLPGAFTTLSTTISAPGSDPQSYYAEVDTGADTIIECAEDNNGAVVEAASCIAPG